MPTTQPCQQIDDLSTELNQKIINEKIIDIQCQLIKGHSFQAIMKANTEFIYGITNASIMAICINHQQQLSIDFLGTSKKQLLLLLKKHNIQAQSLMIDDLLTHYHSDLLANKRQALEINSLEKVFDGLLNKVQYQQLESELGFSTSFAYPLYTAKGDHIGYALYFYLNNHCPHVNNLQPMTDFLQRIILPLYDRHTQTFYSKCIRTVNQPLHLTPTEKRIIRKLLAAKTYNTIADEMYVSINTIKTHMKHIFEKFEINSKIELFNKLKGTYI